LNVEHIGIAQFAEVIWLSAGGGIQESLIQKDTPTRTEAVILSLGYRHTAQHLGREIVLKGIVVIEAASGH
jgi:hypothetical protein